MPAEAKAPKTAEELEKIRQNYDDYNAAMGRPNLKDKKWEEATMKDIENFPQDVKDRLADCNQAAAQITKQDIKILKGLPHPHPSIRKVCATAAYLLVGENDHSAFLKMSTYPDKVVVAIKGHEPLHLTKDQIKHLNNTKGD